MKTVLLIHASGAQYFKREQDLWREVDQPCDQDKLWVIANLPEETQEAFHLPALYGRDRSHYLQRRLINSFPHSLYRAAPLISGNWLKPGFAMITGLTTAEIVSSPLEKLTIPVAGVWGMATLLTLFLKQLAIQNVLLVMPCTPHLRILVIKDGIPVLTRCVQRDSEENDSDEILRTRQHLEHHRLFEHNTVPPVLYLGDAAPITARLTTGGLTVLPVPDALAARGEAAYWHPLFEYVTSSPEGQLAPMQLRVSHLAENIRRTAYAGIVISLLATILFGQDDFRTLLSLHRREQELNKQLQQASSERAQLAGRISESGLNPARVRQATTFSALEIDAAPKPEAILQLAATAIADLPQVRIKNLTYRFPKQGERYCQGHTVIEVPLINRKVELSIPPGSKPNENSTDNSPPARYTELQFSILLTEKLPPERESEIRKRISAVLKNTEGIQLMDDPAAISLLNPLKGGTNMDSPRSENLWCMSIPWKPVSSRLNPDGITNHSTKPLKNNDPAAGYLPSKGEGTNESLRESHLRGFP